MATKKYTRQELEALLTRRYKGQVIQFNYPGKELVSGMCDQVSIDDNFDLILQIKDTRYTCSVESINDCIKILRS